MATLVANIRRNKLLWATGLAVLLAIAAGPFVASEYRMMLWAQAFLYGVAAISLDLVWGYTGIPDLGHSVWFAIGALCVGMMTTTVSETGLVSEAGGEPHTYLLALLLGIVVAGALAGVVGWFALAARGVTPFFIAIVSLALATAGQALYTQMPRVTGGENGLFGFAVIELSFADWYWLCAALLLLVVAGALVLVNSDFGLLLRAIRDNERRARYLGHNVAWLKVAVFVLGAGLAALAGGIYACMSGLVSAPLFGFLFATEMLVWVAVGGRGTIVGPAIGAIALSFIGSELNREFPAQWGILVGMLFVAVVVFMPDGVVPQAWRALARRFPQLCAPPVQRTLVQRAAQRRTVDDNPVVLQIKDLRFSYGSLAVLRGIDLEVRRGELLCIVGPNGAGKSTLIEVLCDDARVAKGEICFELIAGREHRRSMPHRLVREGAARKFQIPALFDSLTVAESILLAEGRGALPSLWRRTLQVAVPRAVYEIVDATGLAGRENVPGPTLAHGLKQGLEIAMAVAPRPQLLLLDEPTAGLTGNEREVVGKVLRRLVEAGMTVVLIEHDLDFVNRIADRIAVLHDGRVLECGLPAEISASAVVRHAYLGVAAA